MALKEKKLANTDQIIRVHGVVLFETLSDTISLAKENKRYKIKLFTGANGGQFLIKCKEPMYLVLPAQAVYYMEQLSGESEIYKFERLL